MGVTQIDNTNTVSNAAWKVQVDKLTSESGIVKEDGTIHYIDGKLKYHANGNVLPLSGATEFSAEVLDYVDVVGTETAGNRYLMSAAAENPYTIAEYNGTAWVYTPLVVNQFIEVLATGKIYRYAGSGFGEGLQVYGSQKALQDLTLSRKTASYTLVAADNGKVIEMNLASANNVTINNSIFSAGQQVLITQYGAGQTTIIAGSGVTLRSSGGKLKLTDQYATATLIFISASEAYVTGNLTA